MSDSSYEQGRSQSPQKDTSWLAMERAALSVGSRREKIVNLIRRLGPMAIFEIAEKLEVHEHQISGRFQEMIIDRLLIKTGERRVKPGTNCEAEVYDLHPVGPPQDPGELLGYPFRLKIADEGIFSRGPIIGDRDLPGVPYSLDGGLRLSWRVELVECPGCGRTIKYIEKGVFKCGTDGCNRTWHPLLVSEPGQTPVLALVMKFM